MSVELLYLTKLLTLPKDEQKQAFLTHLQRGLSEQIFTGDTARAVFSHIEKFFHRYDTLPTTAIVELDLDVRLPETVPDEPIDFWFTELYRQYIVKRTAANVMSLRDVLENGNIEDIILSVDRMYRDVAVAVRNTTATNLLECAQRALQEHDLRQHDEVAEGIKIGVPYFDRVTSGIQQGDICSLIGRISVGKSYITDAFALNAANAGHRVLLLNMEMTNAAQGRRLTALGAGVSNTLLRQGRLPYYTRRKVEDYISELEHNGKSTNLLLVEGRLNITTEEIIVMTRRYRPDIIFIDGAYLLRNSYGKNLATVERIKIVVEELKQIALMENIGMFLTFQFARGGEKKGLEGIGWSDAIGQVSSIVLGLTNEEEDSVVARSHIVYKILEFLKGREGESAKIRLRYDMLHTSIVQDMVLEASPDFPLTEDDISEPTEGDIMNWDGFLE